MLGVGGQPPDQVVVVLVRDVAERPFALQYHPLPNLVVRLSNTAAMCFAR